MESAPNGTLYGHTPNPKFSSNDQYLAVNLGVGWQVYYLGHNYAVLGLHAYVGGAIVIACTPAVSWLSYCDIVLVLRMTSDGQITELRRFDLNRRIPFSIL